MTKKFTSFLLGVLISLQGVLPFGFTSTAENITNISVDRVIQLEYDESAEPVEIEVYEGEQIQLDFQLDSELYDMEDVQFYSSRKYAIVSNTGKLVGCKSGEDKIGIYVKNKIDGVTLQFDLALNILPNNAISVQNRNELNRFNGFKYVDYRRRKMELLGTADENAPRLSMEKIQEFIDSSENYDEIFKKINNYVEYPDSISTQGHTCYSYWFDAKGNEVISYILESNFIAYTKTADDGTVIGVQQLYPEKTEFLENGKDTNYEYLAYNQIESEPDRVIKLDENFDELITIDLVEGESVQLDFQLDPEIYDLEYVQCFGEEKVVVSHTGRLTAYDSGQERVEVYVKVRDHFHTLDFNFNVNVLPNENISPENRSELNRLKDFWYMDYRRRKLELVGAIDEDTPRLTLDKIQEFIDTSEDYREIFKKVSNYVDYPDDVSGSGATSYAYWSDPKGNECIYIGYDNEYIAYTKTADDGTFIGSQMLYPEKTEFAEDGKSKNSSYIQYNQIKPKLEGYGTLNLKFIDESTDEPFTETNGTFQLIYNNDKGDIEIVKSWDSSEGSEITISELSRDYTYELRYIDEYHGEHPDEYKYEISLEKGKRFFSFADDSELSCNVYLKKHRLDEPYLLGDVNSDKMINVADVVTLQKWLLCKPNTVLMNWRAADLCRDDKIDVFDLCVMKNKLVKK